MQGKACFNFSEADVGPFCKLADLTATGFQRYRTPKNTSDRPAPPYV